VLNNARFLVVRFFDEKRVVLDALGQRLGGDQGTQGTQGQETSQ
jgi:hypothetical protein